MLKSRSVLSFAPTRFVAVLFGLLDSSVWIATYGGGSDFSLYYAISVPCKALILLGFLRVVRIGNTKLLRPFYLSIGLCVCVSLVSGNINGIEGIAQPVGVLISLAMTLMILTDENVKLYMKAFGASCFLSFVTFVLQLKFVPINTDYGVFELGDRYSFIFGTHPNLGGEILITGFIAFCIARLNTILILAIFAFYFIALNSLQARAAMLSLLLAFFLYLYVDHIRRFAPGIYRIAILSALILCIVIYSMLNFESISHLFLLDNEYRGVGTGFVGRSERWETAWNIFLEYPFFGAGFGYFREHASAHSMWLGMLSTMGFMAVFVLVAMLQNGWRIYRANTKMFLMLLSFIPMTILNDRFLNLNPYPFLLFVLLFLPRQALTAGIEGGEVREVWQRAMLPNRLNSPRASPGRKSLVGDV
jgi:hypothetical protein